MEEIIAINIILMLNVTKNCYEIKLLNNTDLICINAKVNIMPVFNSNYNKNKVVVLGKQI